MSHLLYIELASAIDAWKRCKESSNPFADRWDELIAKLIAMLPSGSGIDCGTKVDRDASTAEKLVFYASYHHMNDVGYYDGWTEHTITVVPSFRGGFSIKISGRDRNDIKEYLYQTYEYALRQDVTEVCSYKE